jgi:hypothetical protein
MPEGSPQVTDRISGLIEHTLVHSYPSVRPSLHPPVTCSKLRLKCVGTRAETRIHLSAKRASPFKSAGPSVQSTTGNRGVRISGSNAGYTMFRGSVRVLATHSIRQFPLHFPSRASPCAITFQLDSTSWSGFFSCCITEHNKCRYSNAFELWSLRKEYCWKTKKRSE